VVVRDQDADGCLELVCGGLHALRTEG
jgi:hypothetical protein